MLVTGEHVDVTLGREAFVGIGAIMSPTSTIWVCVDVLPAASVYVQVIVVLLVIGKVVVVVPVTNPEQLSEAVGAVIDVTGEQTDETVDKVPAVATGAIISLTLTCWVCVDVFPFPSSNVQVTRVFVEIGKVALLVPVITPAQLSFAKGADNDVTEQEELMSERVGNIGTGAVTSSIITVCVCVKVVPAASL
jgi:hypothetical protein